MNFRTFKVNATKIFPQSNSKAGGQHVTEWNLRSREMVGTSSDIKYSSGPSYVHSLQDFDVSISDDLPSSIKITKGSAIINGHYFESYEDVTIDLAQANKEMKAKAMPGLVGLLGVGLKAYYSTEPTMSGTMLDENSEGFQLGVQVVILPKAEFLTPEDSPSDRDKVTANLLLATINYSEGKVKSAEPNNDKLKYIPAERVRNVQQIINENYVTKTGLKPGSTYAFAGKGAGDGHGSGEDLEKDTWCPIDESLIVWDKNPIATSVKPVESEAKFVADADLSKVTLSMPHHQIEGWTDPVSGLQQYYETKRLELPEADYNESTPGIVTKQYTAQIKQISNRINTIYQNVKGKQIGYIDVRLANDKLPPVNQSWQVGDYLLVGQDLTSTEYTDSTRPPVTMYCVLPGVVTEIELVTSPDPMPGLELGYKEGKQEPPTEQEEYQKLFFTEDDIDNGTYRGIKDSDYFTYKYIKSDTEEKTYRYRVSKTGKKSWSSYLPITGQLPLAQESIIGGFYNISPDVKDAGYVYLDDYGRLKLTDYALLRSGTLAYQLGESYESPAGITSEEVQIYLDEYVNNRVAFLFDNSASTSNYLPMIDVIVTLPEESSEDAQPINIHGIDSRFNTAVNIILLGNATSATIVNIYDCEKVKVTIREGSPTIRMARCCLYYDSVAINYINRSASNAFVDMKLWYAKLSPTSPNLTVNDMTIRELDGILATTEMTYWSKDAVNDNHYLYGLHSISFNNNLIITDCELIVSDRSTNNITDGDKIVMSEFSLPQGSGLTYPDSCLVKQLSITGSFISSYYSSGCQYLSNVSFTALSDQYVDNEQIPGSAAIYSKTSIIPTSLSSIPAWSSDSYHIFRGGAIS